MDADTKVAIKTANEVIRANIADIREEINRPKINLDRIKELNINLANIETWLERLDYLIMEASNEF